MSTLSDLPQVLQTERLKLRPPQVTDAPVIASLAHNPKIAAMTATIPYPYPLSAAQEWIEHVEDSRQRGLVAAYLICRQSDEQVMGVISLRVMTTNEVNLAYWLGEPYWGQGFCSEAAHTLLNMAKTQKIGLIIAKHLAGNTPSQAVIRRLGFQMIGQEAHNHRGQDHTFIAYTLTGQS